MDGYRHCLGTTEIHPDIRNMYRYQKSILISEFYTVIRNMSRYLKSVRNLSEICQKNNFENNYALSQSFGIHKIQTMNIPPSVS